LGAPKEGRGKRYRRPAPGLGRNYQVEVALAGRSGKTHFGGKRGQGLGRGSKKPAQERRGGDCKKGERLRWGEVMIKIPRGGTGGKVKPISVNDIRKRGKKIHLCHASKNAVKRGREKKGEEAVGESGKTL